MSAREFANPAPLAKALETWFQGHARDYPWRRTTDPYAILVSEMMLQQTQIATVLGRGLEQVPAQALPTAVDVDE